MSAYNRRGPLHKQRSFDAELDLSSYTSFRAPLNSTAETPFLLEADAEFDAETENDAENCCNLPNAAAFRTPRVLATSGAQLLLGEKEPLWAEQRSQSPPKQSDSSATPHLQALQHLPKRRKQHFQPPHSSPKKSKKLLFPQEQRPPKNRFYGGMLHLDIIARLAHTQPALECILQHVNAQTLHQMTQVSAAWKEAVFRSQRAVERLQNHRLKLSLSKENPPLAKRRRHLARANTTTTVPLQSSNQGAGSGHSLGHGGNSLLDSGYASIHLLDADAGRVLREQRQRVKCPRCGRASRVFTSEAAPETPLSQTLPLRNTSLVGAPLTRFLSLDLGEMQSPSPSYSFAECTSLVCQFRFCVNCFCKSHPGERCLVTELDTPSKLMMPRERLTPPQRAHNRDPKTSRKNSLKRLCF
ncbi:hypothetical protein KR018_012258 [Drosophila ironensis]|nr:hypothetical protein KR018_012258 [Drosophila ironensis]